MIFQFIENPFDDTLSPTGWQTSLETLGAAVAAQRCKAAGYSAGKIQAAIAQAARHRTWNTLVADLVLVLNQLAESYDGPMIYVSEVIIPELALLPSINYSRLQFQDCACATLDLPTRMTTDRLPHFVRCFFAMVEGRTGYADLPKDSFEDCEVDTFENPGETTNAILALSLPLGTKVILTILKKLYAQRGSGRRDSALYRGLDARAQNIVPDALQLLSREGFAIKTKQGAQVVWVPVKSSEVRRRALTMLTSPNASQDSLIAMSRDL